MCFERGLKDQAKVCLLNVRVEKGSTYAQPYAMTGAQVTATSYFFVLVGSFHHSIPPIQSILSSLKSFSILRNHLHTVLSTRHNPLSLYYSSLSLSLSLVYRARSSSTFVPSVLMSAEVDSKEKASTGAHTYL